MALPQAQLGSIPNINLGGYVPAARQEDNIWERALAAFLSGAAGQVAGRAVDRVLPDPQQVAQNKIAERQVAVQERNSANSDKRAGERLKLDRDTFNALEERAKRGELTALEKTIYDRFQANRQFEEGQRVNTANINDAAQRTANDTARTQTNRDQLSAQTPVWASQTRANNAQAESQEQINARMRPKPVDLGNLPPTTEPQNEGIGGAAQSLLQTLLRAGTAGVPTTGPIETTLARDFSPSLAWADRPEGITELSGFGPTARLIGGLIGQQFPAPEALNFGPGDYVPDTRTPARAEQVSNFDPYAPPQSSRPTYVPDTRTPERARQVDQFSPYPSPEAFARYMEQQFGPGIYRR